MSLRAYLHTLQQTGQLVTAQKPISKQLAVAGLLKALEPAPVLCSQVIEADFPVLGNLLCSKDAFAAYLGIPVQAIIPTMMAAIDAPTAPHLVTRAPCQEVIRAQPDLDDLPILFHCEGDGGNYISSGVMIAGHPRYGQNMDFHRCMQFSKSEMGVRVVKGRNFDAFLEDLG
ncbi:MAG: UbiD family decarboxylase domain-containing protein, partial [Brevefilum sp.]